MSKGSVRRPQKVDEDTMRRNWERAFGELSTPTIGYHHVDCIDDQWRWCIVRDFDGQYGDVVCVLEDEEGGPMHALAERIITSGILGGLKNG